MSALLKRFPGACLSAPCRGFPCKRTQLEQPQSGHKVQRSCAWLLRCYHGRATFSNCILWGRREGLKIGNVRADREETMTQTKAFHLSLSGQRAPVDYDRPAARPRRRACCTYCTPATRAHTPPPAPTRERSPLPCRRSLSTTTIPSPRSPPWLR